LIEQINIKIFSIINQYAGSNQVVDKIAVVIAEYLPFVFILALIYLLFSTDSENKHSALYSGYSAIVGVLVNLFITLFYFHPRPFMENIGTTLIKHAPESSFPSDHTTFMLSVATMLTFAKSTRVIGIILFLLGLLGGFFRVFCGIHFPADILGSFVVSVFASIVIFTLRKILVPVNNYVIHIYMKLLNKQVA